jgi:hypothetical protein
VAIDQTVVMHCTEDEDRFASESLGQTFEDVSRSIMAPDFMASISNSQLSAPDTDFNAFVPNASNSTSAPSKKSKK